MTLLGIKVTQPVEHIDPVPLNDTHKLKYITFTVSEFTSVCPVTGQPDYYTITITIRPFKCSIESKSLKLWLWKYRNYGIFCESLAEEVLTEIVDIINPISATVAVGQQSRGGIEINSVASYEWSKL